VLPLVRRHGWPAARLLGEEGWPHGGIAGALAPAGILGLQEAQAVFADLARRPALRVFQRFGPRAPTVWPAAAPPDFTVQHRMTQVLDLDGGFGTVWDQRFHRTVRQGVRRAEKSAVTVQCDRAGNLVPAYHRLYATAIRRWAERQHEPLPLARWRHRHAEPPRALRTVADRFGESCAIWMASVEGEPAAAIVVLRQGGHAKYWRGAMNRELAHPVRANLLLHSLAIEDACAQGCRFYDMGDSRPDSSLAAFKESLGAHPHDTVAYRRERLPLTPADHLLKATAKRLIHFQEA
jgi:hypothetical protein